MKDIKTLNFKDIKHFVSFVMREYNKLDFLNYSYIMMPLLKMSLENILTKMVLKM